MTIDLIDSVAKFFTFPDGQIGLDVDRQHGNLDGKQTAIVQGADAKDYFALQIWAAAVHFDGGKARALIPYLPGARSDKGYPPIANNYANMINMAECDEVVCFDWHSVYMPTRIKNLKELRIEDGVGTELAEEFDFVGVIIPDEGAKRRATEIAECLSVPTYQAYKHRDQRTGDLSGFTCDPLPEESNLLVVDDICDGGGTFVGLAKVSGIDRKRLSLYVSHGIFSKGFYDLSQYYGEVITTDSLRGGKNSIPFSLRYNVINITDKMLGVLSAE